MFKFLKVVIVLTMLSSCKKSTLIEQVDVPAEPIEAAVIEGGSSKVTEVKADEGIFKMYILPFEYKDLEPSLDATSIEIHYSKHHLNFVNNLNKLIIGTKYEIMSLTDILKNVNNTDIDVRNNAGGFYNHNFFWENLKAKNTTIPQDELMNSINRDFGSFEEFKTKFSAVANQSFGSGWCWLVSDKYGKLRIVFTPNNDNPLMRGTAYGGIPLLTLDLWEHAYYLKFQNRKREYINTFYGLINWDNVSNKYNAIPNKVAKPGLVVKTVVTEQPVTEQDSI